MTIEQTPKNTKLKVPKESYGKLKMEYESQSCKVEVLAREYGITREYLTRLAKAENWEGRRAKAKIKTAIKEHLPNKSIVAAKEELKIEHAACVDAFLKIRQEQEAQIVEQPQPQPQPQPEAAEASIILDTPQPNNEDILNKELFAAARRATIEKLNSDGELLFAKLVNRLMETTNKMLETDRISEILNIDGIEKIEMREVAINDVKDLKFASDIVRNVGAVIGKVTNTQQNNFQFNSTNINTAQAPQNNIKYTQLQEEKARVLLASTIPITPEPEVTNADATINQ